MRKVALSIDRILFPHVIIEVCHLILHKSFDIPAVSPSVTGGVSLTILPQAYGHGNRGSGGNLTPRTLNSLTAIAGQEGEEDEWEIEIRDLRNEDEVFLPLPHTP